jgi:hypothetical protein
MILDQQNPVRIPIQFTSVDSPSNLIDFDRKTDQIRPCIVCKRYFDDLSSTGLCSECDYKKVPRSRRVIITQSTPINTYSSIYKNSDFISPLSSSSPSKIRGPLKISCPNCKYINMVNSIQNGMNYTCSVCRTFLPIPRY